MFKFNYKQVMLYYDQEVKKKSNENQIHASQTVTRDHYKELNVDDGDELFILAYTNDFSVITKQPIRVVGDDPENGSPDWTLESNVRDRLQINPGDKLKRWFTKTQNITPPSQPDPLPQRNLITNGGGEADPTNGTWLHASTQELSRTESPRDNIDGNISLRKTESPYRQYLLLPTDVELLFRAEFENKSVEFSRTLNGSGKSLTLPINEREYLGVEPGDEVNVYIDTQSLVEAQAEEMPDEQSPSYAPDTESRHGTTQTSTTKQSSVKSTTNESDDSPESSTTHASNAAKSDSPSGEQDKENAEQSGNDVENDHGDSTTERSVKSSEQVDGKESDDNGGVEPGDSWRREKSRYADRVSNIANTELTPIVILDERTDDEWPLHYTRSAENSTQKKTLCGETTANVYEDTGGELSTTICPDCLLSAFKENPEHHINKVLTHLTGMSEEERDGVEFTITSNEIIKLIECTLGE